MTGDAWIATAIDHLGLAIRDREAELVRLRTILDDTRAFAAEVAARVGAHAVPIELPATLAPDFAQALSDVMNEGRWQEATYLLIGKVDALYHAAAERPT